MLKLVIQLSVENIDFGTGNFERTKLPIRTFNIISEDIKKSDIDDLVSSIVRLKGDWYNVDRNYFLNNYFIEVSLVFHSKEYTEDQKIFVNQVIDEFSKCLEAKGLKEETTAILEDIDVNSFVENDGYFISCENKDGTDTYIDLELLQKALNANNLEYKTVSLIEQHTECGAGNVVNEFLIFIMESIQSGITWDVIKMALSSYLKIDIKNLKFHVLESIQYKLLRKRVAERMNEVPENIILTYFKNDSKKGIIYASFRCKKKVINVTCDSCYEIIKFSLE